MGDHIDVRVANANANNKGRKSAEKETNLKLKPKYHGTAIKPNA